MSWSLGSLTDITQFAIFGDLFQTPIPMVFSGKKLMRLCGSKVARQRVIMTFTDEFFPQGFIFRHEEATVVSQQPFGVQSSCLIPLFLAARR